MTNFYFISLEATPERTAHAREQFAREGIEAQVVWGVDAVAMAVKPAMYMHPSNDGKSYYYITPGACALVLSHYMAFRYAERDGCDDFVICEDDVILPEGFVEKFEFVKMEAKAAGSLACWLEWCCADNAENLPMAGKSIKFGKPLCTAAVWYQKEALPIVLKAIQPAHAPVDILLRHRAAEQLKATFTWPRLCEQRKYNDTLNSTIHREVSEHPRECID
jgi:GR25 family glycosyltransferase involved in LPS biosynthesis